MKIRYKTVKQFIALSMLIKGIVACSSDELLFNEGATPFTKGNTPPLTEIYTDSTKNGAIILSSDPVGNPYNIDTLKKAYNLLYPNGNEQAGMPSFHPTHYQVRFLPADSLEFSALMNSDLVLTTIPLDKKVSSEGTYYFDPQLEAQHAPYTWQYTIVPVTEELPNVRHEVMAQICAPNDGTRGRSIDGLSDIWPALEEKAYEMCGEEAPSKAENKIGGLPGMPGDHLKRVYVWDDKANQYIPAKGAKVVFWKPMGGSFSIVDENANYYYPGGSYSRVEIQWEDADRKWIIYESKIANRQAVFGCNTANWAWTFRIKGGTQQTFATVTRALHRFYHEYNQSLPVPASNLFNMPLRVICIDAYSDDYAGLYSPQNTIRIWGRDSKQNSRTTQTVFSSTAHELGHLIHYKNIISTTKNWNKTDNILIESWARYVQWLITEYEYNCLGYILGRNEPLTFIEREILPYWGISGPPGQPTTKVYNKPNDNNYQNWPYLDFKTLQIIPKKMGLLAYSPLFIDLFDRDNQADYYKSLGMKYDYYKDADKYMPNDQVSDYLQNQLIWALSSATNLNQLKENIKNARYNTDADKIKIDTLFNRYIYYWNKYK